MVVGAALSAVGFFLWRCARTHLEAAERGEKVARDEHADERSTRKLQAVRSATDGDPSDLFELNDAAKAAGVADGVKEVEPAADVEEGDLPSPSTRTRHALDMDY